MLKFISRRIIIFFTLVCYLHKTQSSGLKTRANFLCEFLKIQASYSNRVIMNFCEHREYSIQLSKTLAKQFYFLTFLKNTNDLQIFKNKTGHIFVLDAKCDKFEEFFRKGYSFNLFGPSNNWLIFGRNKSKTFSSNLRFDINSKIFEVNEDKDIFSVRAIFKFTDKDNQIFSNDITKWTAKNGFTYFNKLELPGPRKNLRGAPLKVSYYYNYPKSLIHLTDYKEAVKDNSLKFIYILLDTLSNFLNATHEASFTQTFGLSYDNKTQTFENNSMMGDVQKGISDVVGSYLWVEIYRLRNFDFIALGVSEPTEMVFRAPTIPVVKNVFLLPFNNVAWYCILFCLFFGTGLVYIILVYEQRFWVLRKDSSIIDVFMTLLSALLQKSWILEFKTYSGKFALAIIYLTFMVIYTAYAAYIIVFLQGTSESIKSFKDLYDMKVDFAAHNVSYNQYYYMTPNNGRVNEHWRKKVFKEKLANKSLADFFLSAEQGIKKVHKEYFAFQCQVSTASYLIQKMFLPSEKCNLRFIPAILSVSDLYLAVRKKYSFMNHFRIGISRIREHGLLKRSRRRLYTMRPRCEAAADNFSGIGLQEIRFIFELCWSAFAASLFFLLIEIIVSKLPRRQQHFEFVN